MMQSTVCTLFEGHYHYGLAALVNSLCVHDFCGIIWVGYKGSLPAWVHTVRDEQKFCDFSVSDKVTLRFLPQHTALHLNNCKPEFMMQIFEIDETIENILYFDPDIVIKCSWRFFEEWAAQGVALCQDVNHCMPANHPTRLLWKQFASEKGHSTFREIDVFYNGGFVGLGRQHRSFLDLWNKLLYALCDYGFDLSVFRFDASCYPYTVFDQDLMNIAAMVTEHPLSTVGPQGMDFIPGGTIMSHAAGSPKPWKKRMIVEALKGYPPTLADKGYWQHTQTPINLYSPQQRALKRLDLRIGAAIGKVMQRS